MGATKRVCEMEIQRIARDSETRFAAVRFGNVLGSNGSVVPLFREQIAARRPGHGHAPGGAPLLHDHPRGGGPRAPGRGPRRHRARSSSSTWASPSGSWIWRGYLIEMHGLRPGVDIEIRYSGLKPGEKLYEELLLDEEAAGEARPHPKIVVGRIAQSSGRELEDGLEALGAAVGANDDRRVREVLARMVPQARLSPADELPRARARIGTQRRWLPRLALAPTAPGGAE